MGRAWLQVGGGTTDRLFLHDIAAPAEVRAEGMATAQAEWGAWTYAQRGHAPSSSSAGGVYRISEFALDLMRLLRDVVPTPVLIIAEGASGLVSALAAAAEPRLVRGLALLPPRGQGWGSRPELLVSEAGDANPEWLAAIQRREDARSAEDDPMLAYGPPEAMPERAVAAALTGLALPWDAPHGHFLERWLPSGHRSPEACDRPERWVARCIAPVGGSPVRPARVSSSGDRC